MSESFLMALIGLGSTVLTGAVTYTIGKRKRLADAQKSELDGVEQAIKIWREMATEFSKKVEDLQLEVDQLRIENRQLNRQIAELKDIIEGRNENRN